MVSAFKSLLAVVSLAVLAHAQESSFGAVTSLDPAFHFGPTNFTSLTAITVRPNREIWVGGTGPTVPYNLLLPDGSVADGENNRSGFYNFTSVNAIAPGPNKTVLLSMNETQTPANPAVYQVASHSVPYYSIRPGASKGSANAAYLLPNGNMLATGWLNRDGDTNHYGIVELLPNLTVNPEFVSESSKDLNLVSSVLISNQTLFAVCIATNEQQEAVYSIGKWSADGVRDTNYHADFITEFRIAPRPVKLFADPSGSNFFAIIVASENEKEQSHVVRLSALGEPDSSFNAPVVSGIVNAITFDTVTAGNPEIYSSILVGGNFDAVGGTSCNNLAAISPTGELLWVMPPSEGPNGPVKALAVDLDASILVAGEFSTFSGDDTGPLVRLNGPKAAGTNYIFWNEVDFRALEETGAAQLELTRAGDLSRTEVVKLVATSTNETVLARVVSIPGEITFSAGESKKVISLSIQNDSIRQNRQTINFHLEAAAPTSDLIISRLETSLTILDDETPGTLRAVTWPAPNIVSDVALASDGKVFIASTNLVRLNHDGTLDNTFFPEYGLDGVVLSIIGIKPILEGAVYVSGLYRPNPDPSIPNSFLALLNKNGLRDYSFTITSPMSPGPGAPTILWSDFNDGSFVAGGVSGRKTGYFPRYGYLLSDRLPNDPVSLQGLPDGTYLASYQERPYTQAFVNRFNVDTNLVTGFVKIVFDSILPVYVTEPFNNSSLAYGTFNAVNGLSRSNLIRFNATTGQIDTNFMQVRVNGSFAAKQLRNGKVLLNGAFTSVNGVERNRVARLNYDGTLDENFDAGLGFENALGEPLELWDNSLLYTLQSPWQVDGMVMQPSFFRLWGEKSSGSLRYTAETNFYATNAVLNIAVDRIGGSAGELEGEIKTVSGGALDGIDFRGTNVVIHFADGEVGKRIIQIPLIWNSERGGTHSLSIQLATGDSTIGQQILLHGSEIEVVDRSFAPKFDAMPQTAFADADGSVVVAGRFVSVNDLPRNNIARFSANGELDPNFNLPSYPAGSILAVSQTPDGSTIFGGSDLRFAQSPFARRFAQVTPNMIFDVQFTSNAFTALGNHGVYGIKVEADGGMFINGKLNLLRLMPDGKLDSSFTPTSGGLSNITAFARAADGSIVLAGTTGPKLSRISATGEIITNYPFTFQQITVSGQSLGGGVINSVAAEPDGSILVAGDFTHVDSIPLRRLIRILPNGTLDTNFTPQIGAKSWTYAGDFINTVLPLPNGGIVAGGNFAYVENLPQSNLVVLTHSGRFRTNIHFVMKGPSPRSVQEILPLPNNTLLVRGSITNVNGLTVNGLFKVKLPVNASPVMQIDFPSQSATVGQSFTIRATAFDPDDILPKTELIIDREVAQTFSNPPYDYAVNNLDVGPHTVQLRATETNGETTLSEPVSITVTDQPVEPEPIVIQVQASASHIALQFTGRSGKTYHLEQTEDFEQWNDVESKPGVGGPLAFPIPELGKDKSFYRIVER